MANGMSPCCHRKGIENDKQRAWSADKFQSRVSSFRPRHWDLQWGSPMKTLTQAHLQSSMRLLNEKKSPGYQNGHHWRVSCCCIVMTIHWRKQSRWFTIVEQFDHKVSADRNLSRALTPPLKKRPARAVQEYQKARCSAGVIIIQLIPVVSDRRII